jgi:hypothetical protein
MLLATLSHAVACPRSLLLQVFSMFLPDVNMKRTCAWYKDSDPEDLSLDDSQVCVGVVHLVVCLQDLSTHTGKSSLRLVSMPTCFQSDGCCASLCRCSSDAAS